MLPELNIQNWEGFWFWIGLFIAVLVGTFCYGLGSGDSFKKAWKSGPPRKIGERSWGEMYREPIYEKQEHQNKWGCFIAVLGLGVIGIVIGLIAWATGSFR
jgi:hypothetical protein